MLQVRAKELFSGDAFSIEAGELGSSGHYLHASPQIAISFPWITFITKCWTHWWSWWTVKWCSTLTNGWYSKCVASLQWQQLKAWKLLFLTLYPLPPHQRVTFHLPTWQEWLLKGKTLGKPELHTGSSEQEEICLAKWLGFLSPKCGRAHTEILQPISTAQKAASWRLL